MIHTAILGVGNATLDIINVLPDYPWENSEHRAQAQRRSHGGNVANTLAVLAQGGYPVGLAAVLSDDADGRWLRHALQDRGIDTASCVEAAGVCPTSYVVLSAATGSRTIVHYRDLPEYRYGDFQRVPLDRYRWFHFEGRNVDEVESMLRWLRARRPEQCISLELEKARPGIERLIPWADALICAQVYVKAAGYDQPQPVAAELRRINARAPIFFPWGEAGAFIYDAQGRFHHNTAWTEGGAVVDTLGAGDTYNAAVIAGLVRGEPPIVVNRAACRLAGIKCRYPGLSFVALAREEGWLNDRDF